MTEKTAIQHILGGQEQAEELLDTLAVMEKDDDPDSEWELALLIDKSDIAHLRQEIKPVAAGEVPVNGG
jgi:hypothetical protein